MTVERHDKNFSFVDVVGNAVGQLPFPVPQKRPAAFVFFFLCFASPSFFLSACVHEAFLSFPFQLQLIKSRLIVTTG